MQSKDTSSAKSKSAPRRPGRPVGAKTRTGKNSEGAGRPAKVQDGVKVSFAVPRELRLAFQALDGDVGDHYRAALTAYLKAQAGRR